MPLYQGEGWIGHVMTMAPQWYKGAEDLTGRNRRYLRKLRERGRVMYNADPEEFYWDLEFRDPAVETYVGGALIDFSDTDLYRQLSISRRGYVASDTMTEEDKLAQQTGAAILKRYDKKFPQLMRGMENVACGDLYIDGGATGNNRRFEGVETFLGDDGATTSADILARPSDTYGGLSTVPASEGGSWSTALATKPNATLATDWPYGQGDSEYDFMSPKLCNYSSTGWNTGDTTFESNCERAIRALAIWCTHGNGEGGMPSEIVLSADLYEKYLNHNAAKGRAILPFPANMDWGINAQKYDGINQEGWKIVHDYDCPAGKGYALNYDKMQMMMLGSQMYLPDGPNWDPYRRSYLFSVACYGNIRYWSPKFFGKLAAYA